MKRKLVQLSVVVLAGVKASLHDLKKQSRVICVPGAMNKVTYTIARMMPERLWYMIEPSVKRSILRQSKD